MTPEQKERVKEWIAALRSGKYRQTRGRLYDGDGYCCLGVACVVAGMKFRRVTSSLDEWECDDESIFLPFLARQYYGTASRGGCLDGSTLAYMNDTGTPFSAIADVIQAELDNPKSILFT